MKPLPHILLIGCLGALLLPAMAEEKPTRKRVEYPPQIEGARVETYKEVDGTKLKLWIFEPAEKPKAGEKRPAIVFFFGGGWTSGSPSQFEAQCRHFASRGMVAMTADYRVASRQQVKPVTCVADAKSCIRWIRANAARLNIDPDRLVAGGGSAGGHLAAATGTLPGLDDPNDDKSISAVPSALILFNPAVVMAPLDDKAPPTSESGGRWSAERLGCEPKAISPIHHVSVAAPPTLILHGKADTTVPYETVEAYERAMKAAGARCELVGFEGQPHGFFNVTRYQESLDAADKFLVSLGYLPASSK